ncbi:hypothetical protein LRP67_14445 [Nocardioides sp. cx-169]|uniref:hypothetical protein n=1 Tax=Nocardioides sp. cx-169 TaxID=2899080 RepID=UPI001E4A19CB|nr:hypothetical protein [Nocardioides sp. cx-169]MCD4535290.1 hypothetical protein [Nocardioides sp. cx-169]
MSLEERYRKLSPEAIGIVDQLVDIAHDEPDQEEGIEWYLPDEEPPLVALAELQAAGIARHYRDGESVIVELTSEGRRRYV